jgi:hypothetical protein
MSYLLNKSAKLFILYSLACYFSLASGCAAWAGHSRLAELLVFFWGVH